jgi:hypothetical protein
MQRPDARRTVARRCPRITAAVVLLAGFAACGGGATSAKDPWVPLGAVQADTFTVDLGQVRRGTDPPAILSTGPYAVVVLPVDLTAPRRAITELGPTTMEVFSTPSLRCREGGAPERRPNELVDGLGAMVAPGPGGNLLRVELDLRYYDDLPDVPGRPDGTFCYGYHRKGGGWFSSPAPRRFEPHDATRRATASFPLIDVADKIEMLFDSSVRIASIALVGVPAP